MIFLLNTVQERQQFESDNVLRESTEQDFPDSQYTLLPNRTVQLLKDVLLFEEIIDVFSANEEILGLNLTSFFIFRFPSFDSVSPSAVIGGNYTCLGNDTTLGTVFRTDVTIEVEGNV